MTINILLLVFITYILQLDNNKIKIKLNKHIKKKQNQTKIKSCNERNYKKKNKTEIELTIINFDICVLFFVCTTR